MADTRQLPTTGTLGIDPASYQNLSSIPITTDTAFQLPPEGFSRLSFEQQQIWLLAQLLPDIPALNECVTVYLPGPLDVAALERSLNEIVKRHELWRTNFPVIDGQPVQVTQPSLAIPLQLTDLRSVPEGEREAEALQLATRDARHIFDLAQGPLLRALLIQMYERKHRLFLTFHRIIVDDTSLSQTFLPELSMLYEAFSGHQPLPLTSPSLQYIHYAYWQQHAIEEKIRAQQLMYWKRQLEHAPTRIALPVDHVPSALPTYRGSMVRFTLSKNLIDTLNMTSTQEHASLYALLVAAFQVLLYRYSGQDDLVIGSISEERQHPAWQHLIGPFHKTLALRTNMSGNPTFHELLKQVHETLTEANAHADVPFNDVVQELQGEWHGGQKAPFQVFFSFVPAASQQCSGWSLSRLDVHTGTSQFDLSLEIYEQADGLAGRFLYNSDLFDEPTIDYMVEHWQTLLENIALQPSERVDTLPLLSAVERQTLLTRWNANRMVYPDDKCMHQIFEAQVQHNPQAVAIACQGKQITYQELNRQANQLAHYLRIRGVRPDTPVALLGERDISSVMAILAIFKAGGAYLPLDPHHPEARLRWVLEQSGCRLVLTTQAYTDTLTRALEDVPLAMRPRSINLENFPQASQYAENLPTINTPSNLAYIIYTSGSTGKPKGAMIEQRGMLNHLIAKIKELDLTGADTIAQTASQCFDISVWQFLAALLVGGRTQIYPDSIAHNPGQLLQQIEQDQVSILETVPSLLRAMLDILENEPGSKSNLEALRWLIETGEALPVELCHRWLASYPHVPMLNAYGPTECSDDVAQYALHRAPDENRSSIPIGTVIPNMQLYVLDRCLELVPVGVSGELYVGGVGVGRGYFGDGRRTAETFIPDPFGHEIGARLYKTGDLVRYLPDGNLEFLERIDFQVKLRGFRIELGEIETVLVQHPAVREAVVVIRENGPDDQRLVAYVVPQQGQTLSVDELKSLVMKQVPVYMVPSAFVQLERLPLTSNGKLDRSALPVPEPFQRATENNFIAPGSLTQHKLAQIWEDLLDVRPIGITDNFFSLGGHSFLAAQLVARIEQTFGKKFPLSTLFAGPTIEQLGKALEQQAQTGSRTPVIEVQRDRDTSRRSFFFLHGDWTGGAFYCFTLARTAGADQPFYVLEPYKIDHQHIPSSLEAMARAHIASLRAVQAEGPYLLGGFCNGGLVAYEMAHQLRADGEQVDLILVIPEPPAQYKWLRDVISYPCNLLGIHQETQMNWFLRLRHALRHIYRSLYSSSDKVQDFDQLLAIDARLAAMFPSVEALRNDYVGVFTWLNAGYRPMPYPEEITCFWSQEEPSIRADWQKSANIKEKAAEIIPGTHMACVTRYIHILAERLSRHLDQTQTMEH